jgi:hypothetical protein
MTDHNAAIERAWQRLSRAEHRRNVLRDLVAEVESTPSEAMCKYQDRLARIVERCEKIIWDRAHYENGQVQENAETAADILAIAREGKSDD